MQASACARVSPVETLASANFTDFRPTSSRAQNGWAGEPGGGPAGWLGCSGPLGGVYTWVTVDACGKFTTQHETGDGPSDPRPMSRRELRGLRTALLCASGSATDRAMYAAMAARIEVGR